MTSPKINSVSPSWVQLLEKANQSLAEGNQTRYYLTLESTAVYDHPQAEFRLGQCHLEWIGCPTDSTSAAY